MSVSKCPHCERKFPDELLTNMFINGKYTPPICGICALSLKNEIHGSDFKEFQGEMAQQMLEDCQEHIERSKQ